MKRTAFALLLLALIAGCKTQAPQSMHGQRSYNEAMGEFFIEYASEPHHGPTVLPEAWIAQVGEFSFPYWNLNDKIDFLTRIGLVSDAAVTTALVEIAEKNGLLDSWGYRLMVESDNAESPSARQKFTSLFNSVNGLKQRQSR